MPYAPSSFFQWKKVITDNSGNVVSGATVAVYDDFYGSLKSISNENGTSKSNPFTTGADGVAEFWSNESGSNGTWFKVVVTKGSFTTTYRRQGIFAAGGYQVGPNSGDLVQRNQMRLEFKQKTVDNVTAVTNPTVNDDSNDGYTVGSLWVNTASSPMEAFVATDVTVGAAVWVNTTLTIGELGSVALLDAGTGATQVRNNSENESYFQAIKLNNYTAIADPSVTNDINEGYEVGSEWINTASSPIELFICLDASAGSARWRSTTANIQTLGTIATYDQGTASAEIRTNAENEATFAPLTSNFDINEQSGVSYTVVASDLGKVIRFTNASPITLTINSGFTNGFNFLVEQAGAGIVSWAGTATLNSLGAQTGTGGQYAVVSFIATATDNFTVTGDYL